MTKSSIEVSQFIQFTFICMSESGALCVNITYAHIICTHVRDECADKENMV